MLVALPQAYVCVRARMSVCTRVYVCVRTCMRVHSCVCMHECVSCRHTPSIGQHALHIAIINQNLHMVKELVSRGADINSPRAIGTFFHASLSSQSHFYYGEHPIAFAACTGQVDIVEYLFEKGADLYVCDGKVK